MYDIHREIMEITDADIFKASHELKGHCLFEHTKSDRDLIRKLSGMHRGNEYDIVLASRFFNEEQARRSIYNLLLRNEESIISRRKNLNSPVFEIYGEFENPVGEGIARNTDYSRKFMLHGLRAVPVMGDSIGRAFYIKTAYPVNAMDDNDSIYDAMDEWMEQKNKKQ